MFQATALFSFTLLALTYAQQIGTNVAENHPSLSISTCTSGGSCTTAAGSIVIDANWRWTHNVGGSTNCYTGNTWDESLCPDPETCATNCAVDGADYTGTYGITANGNSLTLKFVTQSQQKNVGSRVYLMEDDDTYREFKLKNNEFTFDVDVSQLGCGLNGALYFVNMDADGGKSRFATNGAGARYGTGYCDSQCAQDIKFIDGLANVIDWTPSTSDPNSGTGSVGSCCAEMDIWEANSVSAAFTPHVCTVSGQTSCTGTDCGAGDERYDGVCDKDGCDFNSFRMGDTSFFGAGKTVDTSRPFTVVTQFVTNNNSTSGALVEIRRLYVQNGQVIQNSKTSIAGMDTFDSVTDEFCNAQKEAFDDVNSFEDRGGLGAMSDAMDDGMVLVMSLWDDHAANMLWLDSDYPTDRPASQAGVSRGTCAPSSGVPADVENQAPNSQVVFSNIKFGPIGSTF